MLAYALVIASALLHASWNALVKRTRDPAASVHTVVATAGALTGIAAVGEWAVTGRGGSATALGLAAIAGVLEAGYFHALGRALTLGPLGPVYTISRGGAALLVWPASMLAFGERLTPLGAGGSALILLGLAASTSVATVPGRAVQYAVACAGCIAGYNLTYKLALESGTSPILVFAVSMAVATALGATLGGRAYRRAFATNLREAPWATLGAGAICAAGFVLLMYALARGGAAYVFTLRNTSVLFATALAWLIGERPTHRALVGVGLVFVGAVALGLSH
jgi:drug/metabolite transporter (DMT)-like permease